MRHALDPGHTAVGISIFTVCTNLPGHFTASAPNAVWHSSRRTLKCGTANSRVSLHVPHTASSPALLRSTGLPVVVPVHGGDFTVMPRVPRAFCLMAMAMRFFSARVSLRAASIFLFTSGCSLRASSRFSARVPIPSSLDTCSNLCRLVIESVPIRTYQKRTSEIEVPSHGCGPSTKGSVKASDHHQRVQPGQLWREPATQAQSILYSQSKCTSLSCVTGFTEVREPGNLAFQ